MSQDVPGQGVAGDVHVHLSGLPTNQTIDGVMLSNKTTSTWAFTRPGAPTLSATYPLNFVRSTSDPSQGDIYFRANRDESGDPLTIRVVFANPLSLPYPPMAVAQLTGASTDLSLQEPAAFSTPYNVSASGNPDLNAIVQAHNSVHLGAGDYYLTQKLLLPNPIELTADPGAVLHFSQPASSNTPWLEAIEITGSHTHLDGFKVVFDSPINWVPAGSYQPSVIGSVTDTSTHHVDIVLSHLDLNPSPVGSGRPAVSRLIRSAFNDSGRISNNTLTGATTEFFDGPWLVLDNDYRGAVAGTEVFDAFDVREAHDLVFRGNHAHQVDPLGTTYRLLTQNGRVRGGGGIHNVFEGNTVDGGIGARGKGTQWPELIVVEATYQPLFEGSPWSVSNNGRVLQISSLRGAGAQAGAVVAIVSGPNAGTWYRVAQVIDKQTYLMETPLPTPVDYAISISPDGFVDQIYRYNTIEAVLTGSNKVDPGVVGLSLVGRNFGVKVENNHFVGTGFTISLGQTQQGDPSLDLPAGHLAPDLWSRTPMFGITIAGNLIEDANATPPKAGVSIADAASNDERLKDRPSGDRVYYIGDLTNNTFIYSGTVANTTAINLGSPHLAAHQGEILVSTLGNASNAPNEIMNIRSGVVNALPGPRTETLSIAPAAPSSVTATADATTGQINLAWTAVAGALSSTIERSPDGVANWTLTGTTSGSTASWSDAGLAPSTTYYYRVRATTTNGSSPYGTTVSATTVGTPAANLTATSRGQDGHDLVGPGANWPGGGDSFQDIHIVLDGLSSSKTIQWIDVHGWGGGEWRYNGAYGTDKAVLVRSAGAATADLYLQPYQTETGRWFTVDIFYTDSTSANATTNGVYANYQLPMPSAVSLDQDEHDFIGSGANSTGGDGYQDVHLRLAGLPSSKTIQFIDVLGNGGNPSGEWMYNGAWGPDKAVLVRAPGATTADLYLQPFQDENGRFYWITIVYTDGTTASPSPIASSAIHATARLPMPTVMFTDAFDSGTLSPSRAPVNGAWSQSSGVLSQTSTISQPNKKLLVTSPLGLPAHAQITARVRIDGGIGGDDARAGVGLFTDGQGGGYNLVFRGANQLWLLNDGFAWSTPVAFSWTRGTWYWFKLQVVKDPTTGVDTLSGKVWADGTIEPTDWTIRLSGWGRSNGAPSLNGGSDGVASASFDDVSVSVPVLFHDNFEAGALSSSWTPVNGVWSQSSGVLKQTSTADGDPKKLIVNTSSTNTTGDQEILAKVRVDSWADGDAARAGVGLATDLTSGQGYNLVFHDANGSPNNLQFLNDGVNWGDVAVPFTWSTGTWYWFRMRLQGSTLSGKVWADGTAEPAAWTITQTIGGAFGTRVGGHPALNGGSAMLSLGLGSAAVSFDDVSVALPKPVSGGMGMLLNSVNGNDVIADSNNLARTSSQAITPPTARFESVRPGETRLGSARRSAFLVDRDSRAPRSRSTPPRQPPGRDRPTRRLPDRNYSYIYN